jgi:hypothetical protein
MPDGPTAFVGSWNCSWTIDLTFTQPAGAPSIHNAASGTVSVSDNGDGTITAAVANCGTTYSVSGSNGTLIGNQTCGDGSGLTTTFTSGTATVSDTALTINEAFTVTGTLTDSAGGMTTAAGGGAGAYSCTKQ